MFSGGIRHRTARELVLLIVVFVVFPIVGAGVEVGVEAAAQAEAQRTLSGIIYFTNNTPDDVEQFPVELFTRDQKRRVASTKPNDKHRFAWTDVAPGKYLLKLTWPNHCVLWYRVDLTKESMTNVRVIMDAACAHADGTVQDLPEN